MTNIYRLRGPRQNPNRPERQWFTVFMFYDDLEAVMQVEARSQGMAEREAIDAFIEDLDDEEDVFEEVGSDLIRAAISYRTYIGSLKDEPPERPETKIGG
jgi:hypothetical protein